MKCPDCNKSLIGEELYSHKCIFDVIEIPVEFYYDVKELDCDTLIAIGINGKYYRLVHHKDTSSPEMKRTSESPEDETESNICKKTIVSMGKVNENIGVPPLGEGRGQAVLWIQEGTEYRSSIQVFLEQRMDQNNLKQAVTVQES